MPKERTPKENPPKYSLPADYVPDDSVAVRVEDGDDWERIARRIGMDTKALIQFNFHTLDPDEVNYYLARNVRCNKKTKDGKNWCFSSSATGRIYVPARYSINAGAQSYHIRLPVPHFHGTKDQSCWHDSARMIYQYKRHADIHPLKSDNYWEVDKGLGKEHFVKLAMQLGFKPLPVPPADFTIAFLAGALSRYGPLWAAGDWNDNGPHVVVITGADSLGGIWINDPAFVQTQWRNIIWFNDHVYHGDEIPISILYLP